MLKSDFEVIKIRGYNNNNNKHAATIQGKILFQNYEKDKLHTIVGYVKFNNKFWLCFISFK